MKKYLVGGVVALGATMLLVTSAFAAYSLFGDAQIVSGGNPGNAAQLRSDSSPGYGGVDFTVAPGLKFSQLTMLSSDYNVTDDDCKAGSPRFQINVDTGIGIKNIFAYLGPQPNYTGCTPNVWTNDGNLVGGTRFLDTTQLGGTFYDTYAHALAAYGNYPVVGIQVVVDSGYAFGDGEQTILIDNVNINGIITTFEPPTPANKDACKDGGWQALFRANGTPFKNQGDCVSYTNTGR